jgi:hypothetical protein
MSVWSGRALSAMVVAGAVALIGWNSSRFLTAKPEIRTKNLNFLPAPETARVLAFGHTNTVAKLRWIDSFAYFQYQLDRRDDAVAGGGSGFKRLYETLIELDPKFEPFYEHATLNLSGVLSNHVAALEFLARGNLELPHSRSLWQNTIATCKVFFRMDQRNPLQFDAMLAAWEAAENDPDAKRMVWEWKRKFGSDTFTGLEQLPYWLAQLERTTAGTPNGQYVEETIRDLLARYGIHELQALLDSWSVAAGGAPRTRVALAQNLDLGDPLAPADQQGPLPKRLEELLDPTLVRQRYSDGLPAYGPIGVQDGRLVLRSDPYGFPWELEAGNIVSPGLVRSRCEKQAMIATNNLLNLAQRHGTWPQSLAEAESLGLTLPKVPANGTLRLDGRQLVIDWHEEGGVPWPLR